MSSGSARSASRLASRALRRFFESETSASAFAAGTRRAYSTARGHLKGTAAAGAGAGTANAFALPAAVAAALARDLGITD